jgi:hypothetical protein
MCHRGGGRERLKIEMRLELLLLLLRAAPVLRLLRYVCTVLAHLYCDGSVMIVVSAFA